MLFNSYIFIFLFLPITLLGFHLIGSQGHHRVAVAWLVAASLFFYGWWNPAYLGLILGSMLFNYAIGVALSSRAGKSSPPPPQVKAPSQGHPGRRHCRQSWLVGVLQVRQLLR
jgi:hypothetical protein